MLTLILAILPWGMILYYCSRCIGFCILGPHMHFVGRKIDANRRKARKEVQEYKEADDAGKDAILEAYREELMKAQVLQLYRITDDALDWCQELPQRYDRVPRGPARTPAAIGS